MNTPQQRRIAYGPDKEGRSGIIAVVPIEVDSLVIELDTGVKFHRLSFQNDAILGFVAALRLVGAGIIDKRSVAWIDSSGPAELGIMRAETAEFRISWLLNEEEILTLEKQEMLSLVEQVESYLAYAR